MIPFGLRMHLSSCTGEGRLKKRKADVLFGEASGSRFRVIRRERMKLESNGERLLAFIPRRRRWDETTNVSETSVRWLKEGEKG